MITRDDYFMGRDKTHYEEMTPAIESNAEITIQCVNALLAAFGEDRTVNSGWRPRAVNAATPGAAQFSKHMTGQACDLADPHGDLDEWAFAHPEVLEKIGLWQEHPATTKNWAHFQIVPPRSGNRCFYP
jgi:hypothetical protein